MLTGLISPLLWIGQESWSESWKLGYLIDIGLLFYAAFTVWVMPYQSILPEMTPYTDEHTGINAFMSFFSKVAAILGTWI